MIAVDAATVARVTAGTLLAGDPSRESDRVRIDSRAIEPGDCFFAIVGPRDDGHRYAQQAIVAGANILVVQRREIIDRLVNAEAVAVLHVADTTVALQKLARYVRDQVDPLVIAVTGSVGKTTTKTLVHALIRDSATTHATPGNFNNQWGLPLSLLGLTAGDSWMVAELGMSAAGEIAELTALARPRIGVITNVAPVHMENFDSLAGVAAAKRELAAGLPSNGTLIVNADDPHTAAMGVELRGEVGRVITFGMSTDADVAAVDPQRANSGWDLGLSVAGATAPVHLPLPGEHSIANFLAAASVAHALGIGPHTVAERAQQLSLPAMRGQIHTTAQGATVLDDSYNASPAAMMSALDTLAALPGDGRLVLAAGDMRELGSWSEDAHREVGLHAAQLEYDLVFTVGALARDIGHGARAGGMPVQSIRAFGSVEDATPALVREIRPGDRVLVKGSRAVRMEQLVDAVLNTATGESKND